MHRLVGGNTGAVGGNSIVADGTGGIAALRQDVPRCRFTSGSIQETATPAWNSSIHYAAGNTVTSRVTG